MSANNLTEGTLLKTTTARGDKARHVVYIDRRLQILKTTANDNSDCREMILDIISHYPSYADAVESLQYIAAVYNETHTDSSYFIELDSGKLIRNWRNALVSLHQKFQAA